MMLRTISLRNIACLLSALSLAACGGDDDGDPGPTAGDPAAAYAGSCDFPATGSCSDYGHPQATADSASSCASSGGTWSPAQCPIPMRFAVCTSTPPSTRTYAYTEEAAASLKTTCPAETFTMLMAATTGGSGGNAGAAGTAGTAGGAGAAGSAGTGGDEDAGI